MAQSAIETELVKATKFKPKKGTNRQAFLGGLLLAVDKLSGDEYDELTDEAADWQNAASKAFKAKKALPDFPDVPSMGNGHSDDDDDEDTDHEAEEAAASLKGPTDDDDEEPTSDDEDDDGPADEDQSDESEDEASSDGADDDYQDDPEHEPADEAADEDEPVKPVKAKKVAKKAADKPAPKVKAEPVKAKAKEPEKAKPKKAIDYTNLRVGEKDKYGVYKGTKTHEALLMYEKGASVKDIDEKIGGRFLNILTKLKGEGHYVERSESGVWKLIHKDAVAAKKKKA